MDVRIVRGQPVEQVAEVDAERPNKRPLTNWRYASPGIGKAARRG